MSLPQVLDEPRDGRGWLRASLGSVLLATAVGLAVLTAGTSGQATFTAPGLQAYRLQKAYQQDADGDGVEETHVHRYRSRVGDQVLSLSARGQVWAWTLDTANDDDADIMANHVIRDSDCDGNFDQRYGLHEPYRLPVCLQP